MTLAILARGSCIIHGDINPAWQREPKSSRIPQANMGGKMFIEAKKCINCGETFSLFLTDLPVNREHNQKERLKRYCAKCEGSKPTTLRQKVVRMFHRLSVNGKK
jgi:hypothetical protein